MTTIGIRVVCLRTARVTFPPAVMKTATLRPSKSSISLGNRLGSPPALANKILRCAATIVDLKNAADNGGAVNYSFDVVILTPTDPAKANGRLLCEVVSRGRTIALAALQDSNTMDIYNAVRPIMPTEAKRVVRGKARAMPSCSTRDTPSSYPAGRAIARSSSAPTSRRPSRDA